MSAPVNDPTYTYYVQSILPTNGLATYPGQFLYTGSSADGKTATVATHTATEIATVLSKPNVTQISVHTAVAPNVIKGVISK